MRIGYLARRPIPSENAHSVQIVKMCEGFASGGHQVALFATAGNAPAETVYERYGVRPSFTIKVLAKWRGGEARWPFIWHLLATREFHRSDICFGRDVTALAVAGLLGKPVVFEVHRLPRVGTKRHRLLAKLFARRNFSHLVCVTSSLAERCRTEFPMLRDKLIMVEPNAASELADAADLPSWPGRPGHLQVGFVGRPYPGKGIEIMAAAATALPDADFHIVGATRADVSWVSSPMPENLHFHGYQPHGSLPAFYRRLDIAAAPYGDEVFNASQEESAAITSPLKLLEYMAAGLPIVVSDLPGVRDILDGDNDCAVVIPPGDHQAFVEAIEHLKRNPQVAQARGQAARRRFVARHTVEARAKRVLAPLRGTRLEKSDAPEQ